MNNPDTATGGGIGVVTLIGAGPGDPGLLTLRGREALANADVVVYDRLVHPAQLKHCRADAERVYVGKASADHAMRQSDINALIVDRALKGKRVARLKGGDPFVFGRGGEEAEECRKHGVRFEVVPGVTSAIAAPAYAGIPITHRDAASSFAVITGHERDDRGQAGTRTAGVAEGRRNWQHIANAADTIVFLMGVEALPEITARLQEYGRSPETPVALVQWGTWARQKVVTGTLATIQQASQMAGITPPAVCIVGDVVLQRENLRWFDDLESRPLFGKRIVVTRAREQASALIDLLIAKGADPIEFPVIKIRPMSDNCQLDAALLSDPGYDWIVFTSANAVPCVGDRLDILNRDARLFSRTKFAAIGPATADALRSRLGIRADFVPEEAVAESLVDGWPEPDMAGKRVLVPRALEARELLPEKLAAMGALVDIIAVYETVLDVAEAGNLRDLLAAGDIDCVTFTSSSTARNFAEAIASEPSNSYVEVIGSAKIAAIGPVTAQTVRELGAEPTILAETHTIPGLVDAIEQWFRTNEQR